MDYDKKVIASVNSKLESAMKELEEIRKDEYTESIQQICDKIKETILNLDALGRNE